MTKVISINDATIQASEFTNSLRRYISVKAEMDALKEDLKTIVLEASEKNKLDKKIINKYFAARYKAQTKEVAEQGELFAAIDNLIDN
jgi:hypothetical protein